jgi:PAS domain S-box-containing protein
MNDQDLSPAAPPEDLTPRPQRVVGLETGDSSRTPAQEALRASEERYRSLVETTGTGYCILNVAGKVCNANAEYVRLTGHGSLEEILGRSVTEWTAEHDRERNAAEVAKCLDRGFVRNLDVDYVDRAGKITSIEVTATVEGSGPTALILTLCRDISERKRMEKELKLSVSLLRTSEEQFRRTFDLSPVGAVIVGTDFRFLRCNEAFCRFIGYAEDELRQKTFPDVTYPDDRPIGVMEARAIMAGQLEMARVQKRYLHRTGRAVWGDVSIRLVRDPDGHPLHFLTVVQDISERKRAEDLLRRSEERYRLLFGSINDAVFVCGVTDDGLPSRFIEVNDIACQRLGYSREELFGMRPVDIEGPDVWETFREAVIPQLRVDRHAVWEGVHIHKDGHRIPVEISANFFDYEGKLIAVTTVRDITERRRAEGALRESEEKFFKAFHDAPVSMTISDLESGRCLDVNAKGLALTGYTREEVIGRTSEEVGWTTAEDRQQRRELLRRDGRIIELEILVKRKDGALAHGLYSGQVIKFQGRKRLLSSILDITARRKIEDRVARLGRLRQQLLADGPLNRKLSLITDEMVTVLGADFARIWTVQEADLCGSGCPHAAVGEGPDACRDRTRCLHLMASSGRFPRTDGGHRRVPLGCYKIGRVASGEDIGFVTNDVCHDPRVHDHAWAESLGLVAFAGRRLVSGDGRPVGVLAYFSRKPILADEESLLNDIAATASQVVLAAQAEQQRHALETKVQQTQKLESLGLLAGGVAHDFNNLLTAILGHANLALMDLAPESPARDSLREIDKASGRAAELCRQMLAYAGKGRFVVEPINLSRLIEEMAHLLHVSISKKVLLRCQLTGELPAIEADPAQMRQIVMNLVINAAEAIGETDGVIRISTGVMQCSADYLGGSRLIEPPAPGPFVFLEVADTGCGMDAETLGRIFDPFFTTKFTGRGLGLAAVLGIVRSHRGTLKVESERGRGTTFRVLFPASAKAAAAADPGGNAPPWRGAGTILLVDDEEPVRTVTGRMLERCGFTVLRASDGREGLERFRAHAAEIVCVLLDLAMPGMDGEETFRELRRIQPRVRVVLASGYSDQEISQRFQGTGLAGFIEKPYRVEALAAKLRGVLEARG